MLNVSSLPEFCFVSIRAQWFVWYSHEEFSPEFNAFASSVCLFRPFLSIALNFHNFCQAEIISSLALTDTLIDLERLNLKLQVASQFSDVTFQCMVRHYLKPSQRLSALIKTQLNTALTNATHP